MSVDGAPPALATLVESIYELASGRSRSMLSDAIPAGLHPVPSSRPGMQGRTATATVVRGSGYSIAVVVAGSDVIGAINEGSGWRVVGGWLPSLDVAPWFRDVPTVVAVLGSDARPWESLAGSRADSIHLIALDNTSASIVGIPRDAWVSIDGGPKSKINSALARGGAGSTMRTLEDATGLVLDGYVLTGFLGFQEILGNVLGGVNIDLPYGIADTAAGAFFDAGFQYMNGPQALALSRTRKTLPSGDFERQRNGGRVLLAALSTAQILGPEQVPGFIVGAVPWLDTDLDPATLLGLFLNALAIDTSTISNEVAPGSATTRGSASVVILSESAADLFKDLADAQLGN